MGTIAFVDLGLIAVAIAEPIMPGNDPGFLVMALSGIVGALLGGLLIRISSDADPLDEVLRYLRPALTVVLGTIILLVIASRRTCVEARP